MHVTLPDSTNPKHLFIKEFIVRMFPNYLNNHLMLGRQITAIKILELLEFLCPRTRY